MNATTIIQMLQPPAKRGSRILFNKLFHFCRNLERSRNLPVCLILCFILLFTSCSRIKHKLGISEVKMRETELIIPTYLVGDAEENPIFYTPQNYQGAQMHIYPYPLFNKLTDQKVNKKYKALILENRYIEICILPELGGRLYYAKDKTNGYNFFYHNRVIKPALIGMAGAWISGGIEWNIPHHHRVSTFMPVDYRLVSNSDGSSTIWVGEYEKRHQTKWNVGLTLYPGKAYIETKINLYNVTPLVQSFLIWANTAIHANENYQVVFPPDVEKAVYHSKVEFTDWPISHQHYRGIDFTKGVDISWWKNTSSPTSFFAWGSEKDFLGGIDHGKNAGTVLIGDHNISKGKKMWNWGNNEVARLWDKKLTDEDGTYLELMMGAYSDNQPDYSWNHPGFTKSATMVFYPVRGLHHIKEASRDLAINMEVSGDTVWLQANATGKGNSYFIRLTAGDSEELLMEKNVIDPLHPFDRKIKPGKSIAPEKLRMSVLNASHEELMFYQPASRKNEPMPAVYNEPPAPEKLKSMDELYQAGLRLEQFYNPRLDPLPYYFEALRRDSSSIMVNTQLGINYLKKNILDKAEKHLRIAANSVSANYAVAKDAEPLYYLGICLMRQDKLEEAARLLHDATWSAEWLSPASLAIAKIESYRGHYAHALKHVRMSVQANPGNIDALNLQIILFRHQGEYESATQAALRSVAVDPLDQLALYELTLLDKHLKKGLIKPEIQKEYLKLMRAEPDNYLEMAARYLEAGFGSDAIEMLQNSMKDEKLLQSQPMIWYYIGYFRALQNDSAKSVEAIRKASSLPGKYCFPYGFYSEKVLAKVLQLVPADASGWNYLGDIVCDNQPEKAIECWKKACANDVKMAVAYRNMAFVQANCFDQIMDAMKNIRKAVEINPSDPLYLLEADHYMEYARVKPEERFAFLEKHSAVILKSDELYGRYLQLANLSGETDMALDGFSSHRFHSSEMSDINYHSEWVDAQMLKGMQMRKEGNYKEVIQHFTRAMEFPFNLESERDSKIGMALYQIGITCEKMGNDSLAKEYYRKMVEFQMPEGWGSGQWPEIAFFKAASLRKMRKNTEANLYIQRLFDLGEKNLAEIPNSAEYTNSVKVRLHRSHDKANALFLLAMGNAARGNESLAKQLVQKVLEIEPAHFCARYFSLFFTE